MGYEYLQSREYEKLASLEVYLCLDSEIPGWSRKLLPRGEQMIP
jgi:hypothetical protein